MDSLRTIGRRRGFRGVSGLACAAAAACLAAAPPAAAAPEPAVSVDHEWAYPGMPVTVHATVADPVGDPALENVRIDLDAQDFYPSWPFGQSFALVAPGTSAGFDQTVYAPGQNDGQRQFLTRTSGTQGGVPFSIDRTVSVGMDSTPPHVLVVSVGGGGSNQRMTFSWHAQDDGSGIASYTPSVKTDGSPRRQPLPETTGTTATYEGSFGHTYVLCVSATDRVGNESSPGCSSPVVVDPLPRQQPPPSSALRRPLLALTRAVRSGRHLLVSGRTDTGNTGGVRIRYRTQRGGKVVAAGLFAVRSQRFRGRLKLRQRAARAPRGYLSVTFVGPPTYERVTVRRTLRRR